MIYSLSRGLFWPFGGLHLFLPLSHLMQCYDS